MENFLLIKGMKIEDNINLILKCKNYKDCKDNVSLFNLNLKESEMKKILWENGFEKGIKLLDKDELKIYTLLFLCASF